MVNFVVDSDKSILILEHGLKTAVVLMEIFETIVGQNATFIPSNHLSLQFAFRQDFPEIFKDSETLKSPIWELNFLESASLVKLMTFNQFFTFEHPTSPVHSVVKWK